MAVTKAVRTRRRKRAIETQERIATKVDVMGNPVPLDKGGRPDRRFDDKVVKKVCDALIAGNTYTNAARLAGISKDALYRWRKEGEQAPEGCRAKEVYDRIEAACAEAEHRNVMVIQKAAGSGKSWQAAAWFLERRNPAEYGRRERVEVGNADGGVFLTGSVDEGTLNDEEKLAALRGVLSRKPDLKLALTQEEGEK